jgi:hypothetical protein
VAINFEACKPGDLPSLSVRPTADEPLNASDKDSCSDSGYKFVTSYNVESTNNVDGFSINLEFWSSEIEYLLDPTKTSVPWFVSDPRKFIEIVVLLDPVENSDSFAPPDPENTFVTFRNVTSNRIDDGKCPDSAYNFVTI